MPNKENKPMEHQKICRANFDEDNGYGTIKFQCTCQKPDSLEKTIHCTKGIHCFEGEPTCDCGEKKNKMEIKSSATTLNIVIEPKSKEYCERQILYFMRAYVSRKWWFAGRRKLLENAIYFAKELKELNP